MSYRLEYQYAAFRVPAGQIGQQEDRFAVAIEGGDNNVRDSMTGKRARDWEVCMIGTASQVMRMAVRFAGDCEGGSLKPNGKHSTPEAYIRRIRRLIEESRRGDTQDQRGFWYPCVRVPAGHPAVADASALGLEHREESYYGSPTTFVDFAKDRLGEYFAFIDRHRDLWPWRLAKVGGLRQS